MTLFYVMAIMAWVYTYDMDSVDNGEPERSRLPSSVLYNSMDVSEDRKALHHRQATSIYERKLLSLSRRAGFHTHAHTHI